MFPCRMCFHTLLNGCLMQCKAMQGKGGSSLFYIETLFILAAGYGTSVALPDIQTAFGLTGAITGCALVYIFPPAFYLRLRSRVFKVRRDTGRDWARLARLARERKG